MRFNGNLSDAVSLITEWYNSGTSDQFGNNLTGQRLGQFVYNNMGNDGQPWPELFYEKFPSIAESLIYSEFN